MPKSSKKKDSDVSIEELYVKKTHHDHVLSLPDTYIGSIKPDKQKMWVYDEEHNKMIFKEIIYIPGLYKIYDEILVNARDHSIKEKKCKNIKVTIDQELGQISVWNDGPGIRVEVHKEHKIYAPELIFGHLLTSGNYKDTGKIVGGKNGYGAKCCNIFSTEFFIETVDTKNKKFYKQRFTNNMYDIHKPDVKSGTNKSSYTKITFTPDYKRFDVDGLSDDMVALFKKRVYDIAACTRSNVKVTLNNKILPVTNFKQYIGMYYDDSEEKQKLYKSMIYADVNKRWKVGVIYDTNAGYNHVSFVNGICTYLGGSHVQHVMTQITNGVIDAINVKKKNIKIKPSYIKDNITVFIDSVIEDPSFSSQTKETMTSKVSEFGSRCELSKEFIKEFTKTGIVDEVVQFSNLKDMAAMKSSDGKKNKSVRGLAKLDDADWAGTRKAHECKLFLTEGDSSKTFAIHGFDIIGTQKYGVFPLKGKLLNVREAKPSQLIKNEEIKNIKQIIGLRQGKKYKSDKEYKKLRYGGIIILTDQDVDGFHIKGLLMNLIHFFWPSLLKRKGFIQSLSTPIVKAFAKHSQKAKTFYSESTYREWIKKELDGDLSKWDIRYYKGLGTSKGDEAKECFLNFDKKIITYDYTSNLKNNLVKIDTESTNDSDNNTATEESMEILEKDECYNAITLAFSKTKTDSRKEWLKTYDENDIIDNNQKHITINDFVHKELKHFSNYDNKRSIPSLMDGLKPSQRKILYSCFKRNLVKEIKVAQLAGYISENAEYHHGEVSLQGAIINMAQNFVGSNNINLLRPHSNFGTRMQGGKDAASPRYIFTSLSQLSNYIFRKEDIPILEYLEVDGVKVEPRFYYPIIPMILVNGCEGIGTGYSTNIPNYNPLDIINNIKNLLNNKPMKKMKPWYYGYKLNNKIVSKDAVKFKSYGSYDKESMTSTSLKITELPIGVWTQSYKEYLESIISPDPKKATGKSVLADSRNRPSATEIDFKLTFTPKVLKKWIKNDSILKNLKLEKSISISNMHLYNTNDIITKYKTSEDILEAFYEERLKYYKIRKEHYIRYLKNEMNISKYKVQFIKDVHEKKVVMNNKTTQQDVFNKVEQLKYPKLARTIGDDVTKSYEYLRMGIFSLTKDKMEELQRQYDKRKLELEEYKLKSISDIWLGELEVLEKKYNEWDKNRKKTEVLANNIGKKNKPKKGKTKRSVKVAI